MVHVIDSADFGIDEENKQKLLNILKTIAPSQEPFQVVDTLPA